MFRILIASTLLMGLISCESHEQWFIKACCSSPPLEVEAGQGKVFIPNVFTPNFNGINDVLFVHTDQDIINVNFLKVFDSRERLIFEDFDFLPNNPANSWDGTKDRLLVPEEVYTIRLSVKDIDSNDFEFETLVWVRYSDAFPCLDHEADCATGTMHDGNGGFNKGGSTFEPCNE